MTVSPAVPFAFDVEGMPVHWDPVTDPNVLIVGAAGTGKSTAATRLAACAEARGAQVNMIDLHGEGAVYDTDNFADTPDGAAGIVARIYATIADRYDMLETRDVDDAAASPLEERPLEIVLIVEAFREAVTFDRTGEIDEHTPLFNELANELRFELAEVGRLNSVRRKLAIDIARIVREGAAVNVHVILTERKARRSSYDHIAGCDDIMHKVSILGLGHMSFEQKANLFRAGSATPTFTRDDPRVGLGIWESVGADPIVARLGGERDE